MSIIEECNMPEIYAVIMAGGRGERFWPLSTDEAPKPFMPLLGTQTLIQQTVERLLPLIRPERIMIAIGQAHREIAAKQLPQTPPENFIIEPVGRDTAACLGYCALHIEKRDPDGIMLALPADHYIADTPAYIKTLRRGLEALPSATGVVFGIRPQRPETGYGYIQVQNQAGGLPAWPVIRFVEKPDADRAAQYMKAGNYFWNSGIFLWRNRTLRRLIEEHMPELHRGLEAMRPLIGMGDAEADLHRIFAALPRISIDFGVMEKTSGLSLIPAEFTWDDIGNWAALARALEHNSAESLGRGSVVAVDSSGCLAYAESGTIALFGVSDLVVVYAGGKILVCPKSRASELKRLIAAMEVRS